jgi:hypothetical protein
MKHKGNPEKWGYRPDGTPILGPNKRQQQKLCGYKGPSQRRREEFRWAGRQLAKMATKLASDARNAIKRVEYRIAMEALHGQA